MTKSYKIFAAILLAWFTIFAISPSGAQALSRDDWNYFKDHPCSSGGYSDVSNGKGVDCFGNFSPSASLAVPLIYKTETQLPSVTFVYSMTALEFEWAPLPEKYYQNGELDRYWVVQDKEYYDNIVIHPYLYLTKMLTYQSGSHPTITKIGESILVSIDGELGLGDYYTSGGGGAQIGIGIGGYFDKDRNKMRNYYEMSMAFQSEKQMGYVIGPSLGDLQGVINKSHPFYLNNVSGAPTSAFPYYDFDDIHGIWFLSTLSSIYGTVSWQEEPAFPVNIEYMVEIRAWAEPTSHFIWETRLVSSEERGWVCEPSSFYVPVPFRCNPGDGSRYGYWSWEVVKEAVWKEGFWEYPINRSKDWGGISVGGYQVPVADASSNCTGCRQKITQWMLPDLSAAEDYCPILVYESRPLPDEPW